MHASTDVHTQNPSLSPTRAHRLHQLLCGGRMSSVERQLTQFYSIMPVPWLWRLLLGVNNQYEQRNIYQHNVAVCVCVKSTIHFCILVFKDESCL